MSAAACAWVRATANMPRSTARATNAINPTRQTVTRGNTAPSRRSVLIGFRMTSPMPGWAMHGWRSVAFAAHEDEDVEVDGRAHADQVGDDRLVDTVDADGDLVVEAGQVPGRLAGRVEAGRGGVQVGLGDGVDLAGRVPGGGGDVLLHAAHAGAVGLVVEGAGADHLLDVGGGDGGGLAGHGAAVGVDAGEAGAVAAGGGGQVVDEQGAAVLEDAEEHQEEHDGDEGELDGGGGAAAAGGGGAGHGGALLAGLGVRGTSRGVRC